MRDQAHPVDPRGIAACDAAMRWAERHYDEMDPFEALEVVQTATLNLLERPSDLRPDIRRGHTKASNHVGFVSGCPDCERSLRTP